MKGGKCTDIENRKFAVDGFVFLFIHIFLICSSYRTGEVTDASVPDVPGDTAADSSSTTHLHPSTNSNAKDTSPAPESNQSPPPSSAGGRPESPQSPEKVAGGMQKVATEECKNSENNYYVFPFFSTYP